MFLNKFAVFIAFLALSFFIAKAAVAVEPSQTVQLFGADGLNMKIEQAEALKQLLTMPTGEMSDELWAEITANLKCRGSGSLSEEELAKITTPFGVSAREFLAYNWQAMSQGTVKMEELAKMYEAKYKELEKTGCRVSAETPAVVALPILGANASSTPPLKGRIWNFSASLWQKIKCYVRPTNCRPRTPVVGYAPAPFNLREFLNDCPLWSKIKNEFEKLPCLLSPEKCR